MRINKLFIIFAAVALVSACKSPEKQKNNSTSTVLSTKQDARLSLSEDVGTLDPRKGRSLGTSNIISLLFEGLTRLDERGNAVACLAEKIDTSDDMKTYTFHLREAQWSDGKPLTAHDFEYTWKSSLKKELNNPYAYQFFIIKNAQAAYDGQLPLTEVEVSAQDDRTLVVQLEKPTPYFLELLASTPFYPVEQSWDEAHPDWKENGKSACVSNGPFVLDEWLPQVSINLKKNPHYYGQHDVVLQTINFSILDDYTALTLFQNNDLDWTGSPTSIIPTDALASLKSQNLLHIVPAAGTQFLRVNVNSFPLTNIKLRQALALVINRQALVDHIMQADQAPATAFVPPCMGLGNQQFFSPYDKNAGVALLGEAMKEMNIQGEFPPITLSYATSDRAQKIAQVIQQNIQQALGITITLEPTEAKMFFQKVANKSYQLALGSWFADFFDPISFLSVFQYRDNGTNNTGWENQEYTQFLEESSSEINKEKRYELLNKAQTILLKDLPIIPIFHYTFSYLKNPHLKDAHLGALGRLELQHAYFLDES